MNRQPNWAHLWDAFVAGATEARANPEAGDKDFNRAADAYCKRVLLDMPEIDAERRSLGTDPDGATECCEWREDDPNGYMPGTYASACGELWAFTEGGVEDNGFRFCHGCGKPVQVVPYTVEADVNGDA